MVRINLLLFWLVASLTAAHSYLAPSRLCFQHSLLRSHSRHSATTKPISSKIGNRREISYSIFLTIAAKEAQTLKYSELPTERYVVFNRFQTRDGAGPKFEKRWAERKSSLATTDGFRFFTILRRADDVKSTDGNTFSYTVGTPDYMSMSVWATKDQFSSWRKSNAFKEAHGGGSIGGLLSALVSSLFVLKGPPSLAMWEGILPISTPLASSPIVYKGRDAEGRAVADGASPLPEECFVAMNRFAVRADATAAFERRWAERESSLQGTAGFVGFMILRRDQTADDGINYSTCTVWADRAAFEAWRDGPSVATHQRAQTAGKAPISELLTGPPQPAFWHGVLALQTPLGI